jgi:hypothetical protein
LTDVDQQVLPHSRIQIVWYIATVDPHNHITAMSTETLRCANLYGLGFSRGHAEHCIFQTRNSFTLPHGELQRILAPGRAENRSVPQLSRVMNPYGVPSFNL